jgi:hypothetical protein
MLSASVVKLVDTADLKSARRYVYTGSIPVGGTTPFLRLPWGSKTIPHMGATMPHLVVALVAFLISYRGLSQIKNQYTYMNQHTIKGVQ